MPSSSSPYRSSFTWMTPRPTTPAPTATPLVRRVPAAKPRGGRGGSQRASRRLLDGRREPSLTQRMEPLSLVPAQQNREIAMHSMRNICINRDHMIGVGHQHFVFVVRTKFGWGERKMSLSRAQLGHVHPLRMKRTIDPGSQPIDIFI